MKKERAAVVPSGVGGSGWSQINLSPFCFKTHNVKIPTAESHKKNWTSLPDM